MGRMEGRPDLSYPLILGSWWTNWREFMTEAGIVEIIKVLGALFGIGFGVLNTWLITRTMVQVKDNTKLTAATKEAMVGLEEHTNSIKDALVKVTGEAEFARGLAIGSEGAGGWAPIIKGMEDRAIKHKAEYEEKKIIADEKAAVVAKDKLESDKSV